MATSAGSIPITATFNGAQLEKDVLSALTRIQSKSTLNLNTRNFTQPLGKITGLANEFNKSLEASNARVVAFGASAGVIFAVQKSFSALVSSTIEIEKSLIDINIVLNTSAKGIKQFGDQLFEVARNTGSSFKDVAAAATEFSRQGLGLEETLRRTRDALILTRLSGLDVVSSTEALTAAVNSFTKEALTTTDVVNKLAAVDAKFAVSSRDLSEALQRVGSSASEAGVSFDELLGIVTSVQQTTARGGAVIGNALKTIFTRIERPQVINDLKDFGITVTDISGNVLPTIKVIENLAQSFQSLNPVVKSQVAELVGGVYQINILKAALSDVSKQNSAFAEATRASSQAADEAILKNDALNKSLSALINETSANFSQFASAIGNASVAPGIRKVLEAVNKSLSAYNEKDSEGVGAKIATGLLTGITDFITGPGLLLGGLAVGKLLSNFSKFAGDAAKNILGLNSVGRQQAVLQGEISKILSSNPELIQQILSGTKSRLQVEKEIRQTLYEQAALAKTIVNITESQAKRMIASGIAIDQEGQFKSKGKVSAGGFIPAQQQAAEKVGAMQGGYTAGKVVAAPKSIGGVMNTAEKVKYVPGFAQPYILPPEGSRAGKNLASSSMSKNGINPYMARGFVPNFAPKPLTNPSYGDNDYWLGAGSRVPLSQIQTGTNASWSADKGFFRTDGKDFTANDLNTFVRRGASYGDIRKYVPDSILKDDPRWKSGAISDLETIRRDFAPGKKIEGQENIKEGIRQVYEPYSPPASMLVFDLDAKNKELYADENTGEILTKRKEDGRAFKIKSYALNASSQNEEKTNLISRTADFSRDATKRLAGYIRPGEYSDGSVDEFFKAAGKNYNVLAGTIFEASANLAANYTRDQAGGGGGDFDVIGGAIGNVREFFPGFADQFGDYKLKNNDEAIQSFIGKVKKRFAPQMAEHFKAQEKKVGELKTGFSEGFIPNFAPQQMDFNLSGGVASTPAPTPVQTNEPMAIGERSGSSLFIKPDGTLKVSFLRSTEGNPLFSIIKGLKKGLIKKIDAGAVIGPRVPNLITGLKNVLPDLRKNSPLIPSSIPILGMFSPKELMSNLYKDRAELEYSLDRDSLDQINKYLSPKGFEVRSGGGANRYDKFSTIDKSIGQAATFYNSQDNVFLPESFSMNSYMIKKIKSIPGVNLNLKKRRETGSYGYNREDFSKLRKAFEEMGILSTSSEGKATWQNMSDNGYGEYVRLENLYPNGLSKGHIPNFNPVQEAMGREVAAGYSSSQVKIGQSSKLKTNFNPMGLGVYNSTEGSLNNGIGLAEKAGINPKTKGMSARGHIPNFAEFGGIDAAISGGALLLFYSSIKDITGELKNYKNSVEAVRKEQTDAASSYAQELQQIPKDFTKKQKAIQDEIQKTFTNVDDQLKFKGTSTGPLVMGPRKQGPLGLYSSVPEPASPEQVARLEELRAQLTEEKKGMQEKLKAADSANKEARNNAARVQGSVFGKGMFQEGSKFSTLSKTMGPSAGIVGAGLANIISEFIPKENKKTKAVVSGIGDVFSSVGAGAAFGPAGLAVGAVYGVYQALSKFKEAKAEQAIEKINEALDLTKEKSTQFSGSAQNYATSLESLQNALNDPKTRPDALLKFQKNLTEALNSIPDEFKGKVLQAGTDITKVAEAIAGVNKELGNTQKNLERQLLISEIIKKESNVIGTTTVSPKNQKLLDALFSASIDQEAVSKNFTSGKDFGSFIDSLKSQLISTKNIYSTGGEDNPIAFGTKIGEEPALNRESIGGIRARLQEKGVLSEAIAQELDKAAKEFDAPALESIFNKIKKAGVSIFENGESLKILGSILEDNTKRINANAESLKSLNEQFNDINLQISNQIDIEKNRAKTIREINKIQAEGVVSTQRARVKGALDAFTPFVGEGTKNDIQNQLDINEINVRQNSQIRDATSKLLDSLSDSITKKVEEARGKIVPAIEGATGTDNIQKQRAVFQRQIDLLTPVITQGLKNINGGENISSTRESLRTSIINNTGTGKAFTTEAADLLIQSLQVSFGEFENRLAEIKAQNDVDLDIQKASREYQKQSLALNQRLSFAGGAQALGSTGKSGVSDLFDSLSELVSEFRQTNAIGSAAQKGSTSFKFLDVLTNQLQLNRATETPAGFADAQSFNKQVSSDLNPLAATAIAGRVQQIRDSLDLAKNVTEIQTGKSTQGTALGAAFDMAKEGAVKTALDQISSQFKLENMGNYLDVLQQEARALNALTQEQNDLLGNKLPTSINNNFKNVIQTEVGNKLTSLTKSLTEVINKLSVSTQRGSLETDISNLLPSTIDAAQRGKLLKKLEGYKSGDLRENATPPPSPESLKGPIANDTGLTVPELEKYIKSFELVTVQNEKAYAIPYNDQVGGLRPGPKFREGFTSAVTEEDVKQAIDMQVKFFKAGKQTLTEERAKSIITPIEQKPAQPIYQSFETEAKKISEEFKTVLPAEQLKSLLEKIAEKRNLDKQPPLMDTPATSPPSPLQSIIDQYGLADAPVVKREVSPQLVQARANVDNLNKALLARLDDSKELLDLNEKVNSLLKEDVASTEKRQELINLQVKLRKKSLEQEGKAAEELYKLYYESSYGETFFKDERAAFANAKIENNARQGNVDIGAITEKNTTYNKADFARDTGQLIDTFQTDFKSGIGSAFGEAIKGTKTLKDAFRDMFQGILNRMLDKSLEMGVDALFAFGKAATTGRKDGGLIRGYNSGGMVTGGSGMKDDVPAMMSGGEYVIKKSSVDKYGTDYLRNLNGGAIPRYATGGFSIDPLQNEFLYDNPDRPTSGEFAVDSRLSAMALTDENNPQNKLRQDRYEKLDQYLQDRAQYEAEKKQSLKNYKNQVNSTFYSGLTSAAIQLGTAGLTMGAEKLRTQGYAGTTAGRLESGVGTSPEMMTVSNGRATMPRRRAFGGFIAKFAGGGSTGQDNIPALLMGGEYVMNKKAVDMYGKDFMGQLNSGSLPKYANGGMVGTSYNGQTNTDQSSSMDELVTALNALNDNLSKDSGITQSESGRTSAAGATQESGMSVVNNISINMSQGGEVTSEANSSTQKGASNSKNDQNSMQNNSKLAELLRSKVVEVLVEQKRPGGLLYASR